MKPIYGDFDLTNDERYVEHHNEMIDGSVEGEERTSSICEGDFKIFFSHVEKGNFGLEIEEEFTQNLMKNTESFDIASPSEDEETENNTIQKCCSDYESSKNCCKGKEPFAVEKIDDSQTSKSTQSSFDDTQLKTILKRKSWKNPEKPIFKPGKKDLDVIYHIKNFKDAELGSKETVKGEKKKNALKKERRGRKKRKYKPDDIRKKIKARFHKTLKNIINKKLKDAGSEMQFDFLPQSWVCNISRDKNREVFGLTYKEILENNFLKGIDINKYKKLSVDEVKQNRNKEVLRYLEKNTDILKKSGFDVYGNTLYVDILQEYFLSEEFEESIEKLKEEDKEDEDYIKEYIIKAKNYVKFFLEKE